MKPNCRAPWNKVSLKRGPSSEIYISFCRQRHLVLPAASTQQAAQQPSPRAAPRTPPRAQLRPTECAFIIDKVSLPLNSSRFNPMVLFWEYNFFTSFHKRRRHQTGQPRFYGCYLYCGCCLIRIISDGATYLRIFFLKFPQKTQNHFKIRDCFLYVWGRHKQACQWVFRI